MHAIPELDRKGLRDFGLLLGSMIGLVFGLLLPWLWGYRHPLWPWLALALLAAWSLLAPQTLAPLYRIWTRFGLLIGKVTTPLILGIVFFAVITPAALLVRLRGRDALRRRFDPAAPSYRNASQAAPKHNLERPF